MSKIFPDVLFSNYITDTDISIFCVVNFLLNSAMRSLLFSHYNNLCCFLSRISLSNSQGKIILNCQRRKKRSFWLDTRHSLYSFLIGAHATFSMRRASWLAFKISSKCLKGLNFKIRMLIRWWKSLSAGCCVCSSFWYWYVRVGIWRRWNHTIR
jgi:hypothetical protein